MESSGKASGQSLQKNEFVTWEEGGEGHSRQGDLCRFVDLSGQAGGWKSLTFLQG